MPDKKILSSSVPIKTTDFLWRVAYIISSISIIGATLRFLTGGLSLSPTYQLVVQLLIVVVVAVTLFALILAISGRTGVGLLCVVRYISILILVILVLLSIGFVQNLMGVNCSSTLGIAKSCLDGDLFWLSYFLFLPQLFVPFTVVLTVLITRELIRELRTQEK